MDVRQSGAMANELDAVVSESNGEKAENVPVKRVVRLPKPDRSELDATVSALNDRIEKQQLRITALRQTIESKRGDRKGANGELQTVRNALMEVRTEFKRALEVKNNYRSKLQAADTARDTLRTELKGMKDKLNFMSVKDIETEMTRIEDRMAHTTLSLDEEKRLVSQLAALKKSREVVKGFSARQEQLSADEESRKDTLEKMKAQDVILNEIKQREGALQKEMQAARSKEQTVNGDVPNLIAEREACIANIKQARGEIRKARDEFRELENAYYSAEREYREATKKEREERKKQYFEERKRRDEERKKRDAENAPPPYFMEITICEQLLAYLGKFVQQESPVAAAADTAPSTSGDSSLVLKMRTEDALDDVDVMFTGKKKGAKGKKAGKKSKADAALAPTSKLPHSIETYTSFSKISVTVPVTVADVPATVTAVTEKKANYEALAKVAEEKKNAEAEAAAAAAENGADAEGEANGDAEEPAAESEGMAVEEEKENGTANGEATDEAMAEED